jgi:hypothetical protein
MNKQVHFEESDSESLNIDDELDDDEIDILDDEYKEEYTENNIIAINIMNKFIEKYNHLDNSKSKKIIYLAGINFSLYNI